MLDRVAASSLRVGFETLRAIGDLHGVAVNVIETDDGLPEFISSSGPYWRAHRQLDDLADWLQRVTGKAVL